MADFQELLEPVNWPAPVRRVLVRWDGEAWSVLDEVRVPSMTLPAPDPLPAGEETRGFWVEAVDAKGRVRHRVALPDLSDGVELFEEGGEVTRMLHPPHAHQSREFELLMPDVDGLKEIRLVSNPPGAEGRPRSVVIELSPKDGKPPDKSHRRAN